MKKSIIFLLAVLMVTICFAQETKDVTKNSQMDSIIFEGIYRPRFKMYQTENFYHLLKLDTRTGQVWQVQYGLSDVIAYTKPIYYNYYHTGIIREDEGFDGRFELYPTKNMYNFILLDTYSGETYQVQWNTDPDKRFIENL